MELSDLSKRDRTIIYLAGIALVILLAVALYKFILTPEIESYRSAQARYYSQQEENKRMINRRDALLKEYVDLRTKFSSAQRFLFSKIEAEDWLENLPGISIRTGNNITSLAPKDSRSIVEPEKSQQTNVDKTRLREKDKLTEEQKKEQAILAGISEMPVSVSIRGKYGNIINLFDYLERFKQLMVISEFNVAKSSKDPSQVETKFQLNLIHTNTNLKALPIEVLVMDQMSQPSANVRINESTKQAVLKMLALAEQQQKQQAEMETKVVASAVQEKDKNTATAEKPVKKAVKATTVAKTKRVTKLEDEGIYSLQIGVFKSEENAKEITELMKSKKYDPWIKYETSTDPSSPYIRSVYVGRFKTKEEAMQFGDAMKKELPWTDGYIIKKTE